MVAYLDDWFLLEPHVPGEDILLTTAELEITLNMEKSSIKPV
jgi:hypothetical protein